ncbi:MAG: O-antigen ligase family protein [Verrucomicrobiota bacterium]
MWDRDDWDKFLDKATLVALVSTLGLGLLFFGGVRTSDFAGMLLLAGVALGLTAVRLWTAGTPRLLLHPVLVPAAGFLGYAVWRTQQAPVGYPAEKELLLLVLVAVIFWVGLQSLYRQETVQNATHVLVAFGTLVAAYALIQWVSNSNRVLWLTQPPQYFKRAGGTFVNPNHLAGFLSLVLPLAVAQVFVGRGGALLKVLYTYASLMMLGAVGVTMSRGGWLAVGVGLASLLGWLGWRRWELRIPVAITAAVLVLGGWNFLERSEKARARIENLNRDGNIDSGQGRGVLWGPAWAMWKDHVWMGVGPGQFDVRFPQYRGPRNQTFPGWVHNDYLNLLVDYGVVGAGLAAATLLAFGWGVVRSLKYVERGSGDLGTRSSNRTAFYLGSTVGLGSLAVHVVVDFDLHIPAIAVVVSLVAALLASHLRHATERFWFGAGPFSRVLLTLATGAVVYWLAGEVWTFGREGLALNRAAVQKEVTDTLIADLKAAAAARPDNPKTAYELGENLRRASFEGEVTWRELATEAVQWLERAAVLDPYSARTQLALGQTHRWLRDPEKGAIALQKAEQLGPNDILIASNLAWYALQDGRLEEARRLAKRSLEWQWWSNDMARAVLEDIERQGLLTTPQTP